MGVIALAAEKDDPAHDDLWDLVREARGEISVGTLEDRFEVKFGIRPLLLSDEEDIQRREVMSHALKFDGIMVSLPPSASKLRLVS